MSKNAFEKFSNPQVSGAKKKEAFRQEKRKAKADARAAGEAFRKKKREQQLGIKNEWTGPKKIEKRVHKNAASHTDTPASKDYDKEKADLKNWADSYVKGDKKAFAKTGTKKEAPNKKVAKEALPEKKQRLDKRKLKQAAITQKPTTKTYIGKQENVERVSPVVKNTIGVKNASPTASSAEAQMPLNKFIAHAGICGRREAAALVKEGKVIVNGDVVYEPGYKVSPTDTIKLAGKKLQVQKDLMYVLLNKPKDYLTTTKDPEGRKTVLDLVKDASTNRLYPVGRLDRNTTGVLLMTNDGDLAQKLTHPSFQVKKIYEVKLDKPLVKKDYEAITNGITLEDGFIQADSVGYIDQKDKGIVGIEIHSGRNRIVRRIFEHLGYDVKGLDRVMFANLTKKNVDRGTWRMLNEKEVRLLKYMNQSFSKKKVEPENWIED